MRLSVELVFFAPNDEVANFTIVERVRESDDFISGIADYLYYGFWYCNLAYTFGFPWSCPPYVPTDFGAAIQREWCVNTSRNWLSHWYWIRFWLIIILYATVCLCYDNLTKSCRPVWRGQDRASHGTCLTVFEQVVCVNTRLRDNFQQLSNFHFVNCFNRLFPLCLLLRYSLHPLLSPLHSH